MKDMLQIRKFFKYWLPVILWALVIFIFSTWPAQPASEVYWQEFVIKKSAHMIEYAILSSLIYRALWNRGMDKRKAGIFAIVLSALYGVSDEIHQSFTPGREPTVRDIIFDTIGSILAIVIIWNILPRLPKRLRKLAEDYQLI